MIPALPSFSLGIPSTSLTSVRGGYFCLAGHHLIEWPPVPAADSFIQSGAGDHSIEPPNHFTHVDADGTPEDLNATVEGIGNVKLSGPLAAPRHIHDKRGGPKFRGCTPVEIDDILAAIYTGWKDARRAASGTDELKESDKNEWATKYRRWFGPIIEARRGTVEKMLLYIESKVRFRRWAFLCRTGERAEYPAKICNYTLEPWGCYSVTDAYLDQSPTPEKSRSTKGSGTARLLPGQILFSA